MRPVDPLAYRAVAAVLGLLLGGCGSGDARSDGALIGGMRPVHVHVPPAYGPGARLPLVLMLHGYGATGGVEEAYLQLTSLADARGFLYAYPDGTTDSTGLAFWNATDACCNLYGSHVDDSTYLSGVIAEIEAHYSVDAKRVFIVGHSNGGFMAYRMACDHADQVAAVASLAGATWADMTKCSPSAPVSIVEIHGTADSVIGYRGGTTQIVGMSLGATYPGAATTVLDWASLDGCAITADTSSPPLDLDSILPGSETAVTAYVSGCRSGTVAELWTIKGGSHVPAISSSFGPDVIDFLLAHPKP